MTFKIGDPVQDAFTGLSGVIVASGYFVRWGPTNHSWREEYTLEPAPRKRAKFSLGDTVRLRTAASPLLDGTVQVIKGMDYSSNRQDVFYWLEGVTLAFPENELEQV